MKRTLKIATAVAALKGGASHEASDAGAGAGGAGASGYPAPKSDDPRHFAEHPRISLLFEGEFPPLHALQLQHLSHCIVLFRESSHGTCVNSDDVVWKNNQLRPL